jgi:hypothetical protein
MAMRSRGMKEVIRCIGCRAVALVVLILTDYACTRTVPDGRSRPNFPGDVLACQLPCFSSLTCAAP